MKWTRNLVLLIGVAGIVAILLNVDVAFATDGVAQAENALKSYIKVAIGFVGLISVGFVVYGGIRYSMSAAHPDKLEKAKNTVKYALIGCVIALAAFPMVDVVAGIAKANFGN